MDIPQMDRLRILNDKIQTETDSERLATLLQDLLETLDELTLRRRPRIAEPS